MSGEVKRAVRVGDRVRAELSDLLLRGQVRDPAAQGAIVSSVRLTDDLRHARVYVRKLAADPTEAERKALLAAMKRAAGYLKREIGARLQLRYVPELAFYWDDVADEAVRIEQVLAEIRDESGEPAKTAQTKKKRDA